MKISPMAAGGLPAFAPTADPQVARAQDIRKITMRTNATPGFDQPAPELTAVASATADAGGQTDAGTEATEPLSPQYAALARQRRALQQEKQAFERAKAEASANPNGGELLTRLKAEPLSVLQEAGVTYEQLTEAILATQNGITPEVQSLKAELESLKTGVDKRFEEQATQSEQQVLKEISKEATHLVSEGDDFELVREKGKVAEVVKYIHAWYKKTGEVLGTKEALQDFEDILIKDALRDANFKKVQSQLAPALPPMQQQRPRQMTTLTNRDTSRAVLSAKARAIAAFNGQLKR